MDLEKTTVLTGKHATMKNGPVGRSRAFSQNTTGCGSFGFEETKNSLPTIAETYKEAAIVRNPSKSMNSPEEFWTNGLAKKVAN